MALFGFDVPFEAANSADRLCSFKSAAWYALMDEEQDEIYDHTEDQVENYIKACIRIWKYDASEEARKVFRNKVFALLIKMKCLLRWLRPHFSESALLFDLGSVPSPSNHDVALFSFTLIW